jgi:predicted Zn-dependent protease
MKTAILAVMFVALCSPSYAQFGGMLDKAKQAKDTKDKLDDLKISDEEERKIGLDVSTKVRARFGVVQDADVTKYVSLVGTYLARQSERPTLQWTFIVLDTDGVNAFASPGGFVHVTRGALAMCESEAELAGVLAHEIGHVAHKHTINAIKKNKAVQMGTNATLADRGPFLNNMANKAYEMVLEGTFDRGDELDADKASVTYTKKAGYANGTLADFLKRLDDRNKDQPARNGLFASHPDTKERIDKIHEMSSKGGAIVVARFKEHIKYVPTDITSVAMVADGASGLTGSTAPKDKDADKKDDPPKKKGFGLGALKPGTAQESKSAQVSASGGARGVGPDRAAKGGSNPALVAVTVTDADIDTFKKGVV